jgi:hypothetical protein
VNFQAVISRTLMAVFSWLSPKETAPAPPVTTGPFSVIATQRSITNLANVIAGIFREDAPRATSSSAASSGVRSAGLSL